MHLEANLNYFFTTFIKRFWLVLLHITKFYMSGQTDKYCACIDSKKHLLSRIQCLMYDSFVFSMNITLTITDRYQNRFILDYNI